RLAVVQAVVGTLVIPRGVYDEVVGRQPHRPGAHALADASWIESRPLRDHSFAERLPQRLHRGEREALALARELAATLLVDDYEARREARRLGIAYFGSLGVLKQVKAQGLAAHIKPLLDE